MFGDGGLTFQEFVTRESLPLSLIHDTVLEFLRGRTDVVLCGAQAVNAHVDEPRMTQAVDVLCNRAAEFAEEMRDFLNERFKIAVRIRTVADGAEHEIYQIRKPKNRHLVDIRSVESLPPHLDMDGVQVLTPVGLISFKVRSMLARSKTPKGMMDVADLRGLLLTFPDLKVDESEVASAIRDTVGDEAALKLWRELVSQEIVPEDDDY